MTREGKAILFVLVALLALLPLMFARSSRAIGINEPDQPVDFFHSIHSGDKQIACGYCHAQTKQAGFAGMPSVELCMRCHRTIIPNHEEVKKLHVFWNEKELIPWVRVNRLPGFVYFNHKAHINANVGCQSCHGDLRKMDRVRQTTPMNMGWCLDCHRKEGAPTDCVTCHK